MDDALELRRTILRRETEIYVLGVVHLVATVVALWWSARLMWGVVPRLPSASTTGALVAVVGGLVLVALLLVLLWSAIPYWQLIALPGSRQDVVIRADGDVLLLRDAGYTVRIPWSSIDSLRIEPGWPDVPALVPTVVGPVTSSRDPLARLVVKGLRRGEMKFGIGTDDPTLEQVGEAVSVLSGGRHTLRSP